MTDLKGNAMSEDVGQTAIQREAMEYDVVIVGAGPSGLAAAIRRPAIASVSRSASRRKESNIGSNRLA